MFLKQVVKDLLSSKAENYWHNEGCNNRMQNYNTVRKVLYILQQLLLLSIILYFVYISSKAIISIFDTRISIDSFNQMNIKEVEKFIINTYQISFVLWVVFNLINYKINSLSFQKSIKNIITGLLVLPVLALIMFYFSLIGNLMISFWILVVFLILDTVIDYMCKRINYLYEISIGKGKNKNGKN